MSEPRLTDYVKDQIVEAYQGDEPLSVVAERFKIDKSYPYILAQRRGLPTRSSLGRTNKPGPKPKTRSTT